MGGRQADESAKTSDGATMTDATTVADESESITVYELRTCRYDVEPRFIRTEFPLRENGKDVTVRDGLLLAQVFERQAIGHFPPPPRCRHVETRAYAGGARTAWALNIPMYYYNALSNTYATRVTTDLKAICARGNDTLVQLLLIYCVG